MGLEDNIDFDAVGYPAPRNLERDWQEQKLLESRLMRNSKNL